MTPYTSILIASSYRFKGSAAIASGVVGVLGVGALIGYLVTCNANKNVKYQVN